jgi:hypothetical protein
MRIEEGQNEVFAAATYFSKSIFTDLPKKPRSQQSPSHPTKQFLGIKEEIKKKREIHFSHNLNKQHIHFFLFTKLMLKFLPVQE